MNDAILFVLCAVWASGFTACLNGAFRVNAWNGLNGLSRALLFACLILWPVAWLAFSDQSPFTKGTNDDA